MSEPKKETSPQPRRRPSRVDWYLPMPDVSDVRTAENKPITAPRQSRAIGRPAKPPGEKKVANLTFRVRPQMRADLAAAASASGRSVSEEIEHRLSKSFDHDRLTAIEARLTILEAAPAKAAGIPVKEA